MQSVYKMKFFQSSLSLSLTYITLIQHTLLRTCKNAALASEAKIEAKKSNNATLPFWEKKKHTNKQKMRRSHVVEVS